MQSNNWFGYDQGSLASGGRTFHSIAAAWNVPTASARTAGANEYSSTWIGIGGGCVDAACTVTDNTLIQAGTEQDVAAGGARTYQAWWEVVPGPSVTFSQPVHAGDAVAVTIGETASGSETWKITVADRTAGWQQVVTVPYSSTYLTAEWIEETPVVVGTGGAGVAALPNLSPVTFDHATVNGGSPVLGPAQRMVLTDASGRPISVPSYPDVSADGFADCAWSTSCPAPAGS
jgi:hypothetical protein